mmetsp:Transcript_8070/g.22709  ORF Transcript_8070/g.22709 Transcript_8070/m.22709 type:complete len:217 (+) Transcript_8070:174-824(+)
MSCHRSAPTRRGGAPGPAWPASWSPPRRACSGAPPGGAPTAAAARPPRARGAAARMRGATAETGRTRPRSSPTARQTTLRRPRRRRAWPRRLRVCQHAMRRLGGTWSTLPEISTSTRAVREIARQSSTCGITPQAQGPATRRRPSTPARRRARRRPPRAPRRPAGTGSCPRPPRGRRRGCTRWSPAWEARWRRATSIRSARGRERHRLCWCPASTW